ncbi:MAG: hypothetical protein J6S67_11045 [Methanobrevibacter sp.]|nr:hypothetical protein [Methanobrevibacter sp.]
MTEQWGVVHRWDLTEMEFNRLQGEIERLQEQLESDEMALTEGQEIIAELKAQLNEANEVITHYAEKNGYMKAIKYLNKWGVK